MTSDNQDSGRKLQCVRISRDGERSADIREAAVTDLWLRFNQDFRSDSALFIDGHCRHEGRFSKTECAAFAEGLKKTLAAAHQATLQLADDQE